jgi:predicted GNAT family acetyltransferase
MADSFQVTDNPERARFEVFLDGELAGFTQYHLVEGGIAFDHTQVYDRFEGRGVASALIRGALDEVRRRGLITLPFCQFVRGYIARHPDYVDLVPADQRARFGL